MKFLAPCLAALFLSCAFATGQDFISDTAAVRFSYSNTPDRKIEGTTTEVGLSQWALMSPIFYHKAESWAFGAGFRYESANLDFSDAAVFDEDNLHSIDLPLFFSKTQSDTLDWILLFNPTVAGDFEHVTGDSFNYLALAGARWKRSETFEWFSEQCIRRDSTTIFFFPPSASSGIPPIVPISSSPDHTSDIDIL